MGDCPDGPGWRGERAALLAEIEEYYRLYESNALDDDGDWNAWVEDHPRFAAYWQWQRALDPHERYDALMSGDRHLLNWYFDGQPVPNTTPPPQPAQVRLLPPQPAPMNSTPLQELRGTIRRFKYVSVEAHYTIAQLAPERPADVGWAVQGPEQLVTIVGKVPGEKAGDVVALNGRWRRDETHGWQFEVVEGRVIPPGIASSSATGQPPSLWATIRAHPTARRIGGVVIVCGVILFALAECAQDLGLVDAFVRGHQTWHGVPVCHLVDPSSKRDGDNGQTVSYTSKAQVLEVDGCFSEAWRGAGLAFVDTSQDSSAGPLLTIRRWRKDNGQVFSYGFYADKGQTHVILAYR
jgi:hypothetical protein